jgi:ATP-binding cassette subfamily B protein
MQLARAVQLVWRAAPLLMAGSLALMVVQGILPLVSLYLTKLTIDAVTAAAVAVDRAAAWKGPAPFVGMLGMVALLSAAVNSVGGLLRDAQAESVTDHMSEMMQSKSVEVDLEYYESSQYYDTLHRAQREGTSRPLRIVSSLTQLVQSTISLIGVFTLLLVFSPIFSIFMIVFIAPEVLVRVRYADTMYRWRTANTSTERKAGYYNWLLTSEYFAKEIRLFALGSLFIDRFRGARRRLRRERIKIATRRTAAELLANLVTISALYGAFAYVAYRTIQGSLTLGSLVMYYSAFQQGRGLLAGTMSAMTSLYEDNLFLTNLSDFISLKRRVVEPAFPRELPRPLREGIVLDHVRFAYPSGGTPVLEDISLTIRPGETVALVGQNGSGKTTLVKLLCRLYDPTSGSIRMDGVDLREMSTDALRREIGVIFQDYVHYHMTAGENIWVGDVSAATNDGRIPAAARAAGADQVIESLPHRYDTMLGKWFEDGAELSIGQWQKIALARAFLRDAQIVVLDEPTSAMDAAAEYEVFQRFRDLAGGRTTILISHRFSTVRLADRIFVMQRGRISESGSHEDLVRLGGIYARLFEMQAEAYR